LRWPKEAVVPIAHCQSYVHVRRHAHRLARPNATQFTPSADPYMLNTFPLLTSFIQFGTAHFPSTGKTAPPVLVRSVSQIDVE